MPTFEDALKNPVSKKLVFVRMNLRKQLFGWFEADSAFSSIWFAAMTDQLTGVVEDGEAMTETASLSALDAQDTSSVGAWFWDEDDNRVYVKPMDSSGTDIFDFLYISTIRLRLSKHGEVLNDDDLPYDGKVWRAFVGFAYK